MKFYRNILAATLICALAASAGAVDDKVVEKIGEACAGRHALVIHVGAGSGELAVSLAEKNGFTVHGLEPDAAAVEKSRGLALKADRCGAVTIEQADLKLLPYVDQLANAIVIDDWKRVSEAGLDPKEIVRVLAPYGIACIGQSKRFGNSVKDKEIRAWLKKADVKDVDVLKKDGIWVTFVKERPEGMDVWTHKWHDESRNHASQDTVLDVPSALHWINSTAYTWSMRQYRASAREVFYFLYNMGGLSRWGHRKKPTQTIEAYDAYSGMFLWSREIPEASSGFTPIIAEDRIIITSGKKEGEKRLIGISTQTGEELIEYKDAGIPADGCVHNGVLIWLWAGGMKGVDVKTGKILWERKPSAEPKWEGRKGAVTGFQEYCICAGDGMVFVADRVPGEGKGYKMTLRGLDVKSGKEKWTFEDPRLGGSYSKYFYHDGYLVLSLATGFMGAPVKSKGDPWFIKVSGFDKKSGKPVSSLRGGASKSCFAFDGKVWIRSGSQYGLLLGDDADIHDLMPSKLWVAFDIKTGKRVKAVGYEIPPPVCKAEFASMEQHLKAGPIADPIEKILIDKGMDLPTNTVLKVLGDGTLWRLEGKDKDENGKTRQISMQVWKKDKELWFWNPQGWQQRCFPDLGCPSFITSSNSEFVDLETGKITQNRGLRGNCGEGPFFGNGLYYMTPHYCCFCYPMVRGGIAMGGQNPPPIPITNDQRLSKGPAYAATRDTRNAPPEEWPAYRRNSKRICGTTAKVKTPLAEKPVWQQNLGGRVTQAVVAEGKAYVAVVNQGRIVAMDAKTGKKLWDFVAGSRIDTAPTIHAGQVLFGCHDGCVYALRAEDGVLAWTFNAAPDKRKMLVRDRIESSWPVPGAILVADSTAYFVAGRITSCDGGMHMYALNAVSGEMKWHKNVKGSNHPKLRTGIDCWHEPQGELCNAILVKRDNELLLTDEHMYWRFNADTGEQVIPEKDSNLGLGLFSEKTPWIGMDRPTWMANFHGENFVPEIKFPYGNGTPCAYPAADKLGLVFKRLRKPRVMEMLPAKADDLHKAWEAKKQNFKLAWEPVKTKIDVHAYCIADDTVFIVGPDFDPKTDPATGTLAAISLKDGQDLGFNIKLAASPVYDGMSTAYGKVFVSLQDGTLMCLGK